MRGLGMVGLIALLFVGLSQFGREMPAVVGARNVILFIGDGLGPTQVAFGIQYARIVEGRKLHLETLMEAGNTGYALPFPHEGVVTDSAAAATQIGTGKPARNETLGLDSGGRPIESILQWAEGRGLASGIVTTTRLTHGTPAGLAAHRLSRYDDEQILADQILGEHEIEVLLGGGARAFVPAGERVSTALPGIPPVLDGSSVRSEGRDPIERARSRGYSVASDRGSLRDAVSRSDKLLGLFSASHQPYAVDRWSDGLEGVPSLPELTEAALEVLARNDNGFFLMVEGGRIDHAAHANDAGAMLQEILEFDEALGLAARFQAVDPETLLLVTADHGTGGFSFTYSRSRGYEELLASGDVYRPHYYYPGESELRLLGNQKRSFARILERAAHDPKKLQEEVWNAMHLSLTPEEASQAVSRNASGAPELPYFGEFYVDPMDRASALLARVLARQTSVVWATGGHTTDPVLTFGIGPGAEELRGAYVNTHLFGVMKRSLEIGE